MFSDDNLQVFPLDLAQLKKDEGGVQRGLGQSRVAWAVVMVCALMFAGGFAQAQEADEDFTFKRVKPPSAGAKKRINIQVEKTWPFRPPKKKSVVEDVAVKPDAVVTDGWFWEAISPDLKAADPIRLDRALNTLNSNPGQKSAITPTAALMEKIMREHGQAILIASAGKRVSPAFALAVIAVESAGRVNAKSEKGAQGLMQLIPATAERFGVKDANDPQDNITGGIAYLDWLFSQFGGDPILSLAGYNAGENAVRQNNGVPPYKETRAYIPKVVAAWDRARMYCKTIPKFADDGCVFDFSRSFSK